MSHATRRKPPALTQRDCHVRAGQLTGTEVWACAEVADRWFATPTRSAVISDTADPAIRCLLEQDMVPLIVISSFLSDLYIISVVLICLDQFSEGNQ